MHRTESHAAHDAQADHRGRQRRGGRPGRRHGLACDFIVASEWASFAWTYIKRGLIPDGGGLYFLPRRVGLPRAKELIFTGRRVDAKKRSRSAFADRKVAPPNSGGRRASMGDGTRVGSPTAIALGKSILNRSFELAPEIFAQGSQAQAVCYTTGEHRESVLAFLNKSSAKD